MAKIAELALCSGDRVLCRQDVTEGVHLGEAYGFPSAEAHSSDEEATGGADALKVTALRAAFTAGAPLLADGATVSEEDERALRILYKKDVAEGAARFAALGLRWRAERVGRLAEMSARGDMFKRDMLAYRCEVDAKTAGEPTGELEWVSLAGLERDWARGRVLLSPTFAALARGHATASGADNAAQSPGWSVAPHLEMLPLRTPTLPPATHTNAFLVGQDDLVLIEPASPYPEELDVMEAWVTSAAARGGKLRAVLATHHHPDHIGGALAARDRFEVPLWAHAMTAQRLEGAVSFDRELVDGEEIDLGVTKLTAVHTPGHAPGHLCFVDEVSDAMIAGDMVAGVGTILVEPHDGDMRLYLESLRRMARFEPSMLLPAHGGVIRNSQQWLEFYEKHRLMREQKVVDALSSFGALAVPGDLVAQAYDDAPQAVWPLALRSLEAHLIKLEQDGRVTKRGDRWALN